MQMPYLVEGAQKPTEGGGTKGKICTDLKVAPCSASGLVLLSVPHVSAPSPPSSPPSSVSSQAPRRVQVQTRESAPLQEQQVKPQPRACRSEATTQAVSALWMAKLQPQRRALAGVRSHLSLPPPRPVQQSELIERPARARAQAIDRAPAVPTRFHWPQPRMKKDPLAQIQAVWPVPVSKCFPTGSRLPGCPTRTLQSPAPALPLHPPPAPPAPFPSQSCG